MRMIPRCMMMRFRHRSQVGMSVGGLPGLAPVADFSADDTTPGFLMVQFTDLSTNSPTSWHWEKNSGSGWVDFDEGATVQNPQIAFGIGTWSIRLTATNAAGSDSEAKTDYITNP